MDCKQIGSLNKLKRMGYDYYSHDLAVSNCIAEILHQKQISVADLAVFTGLGKQTLRTVVLGQNRCGIDIALKIAYVLNKSVEELFELNKSSWGVPEKDSNNNELYLDHLTLCIVSSDNKKEIECKEGNKQYVNIETKGICNKENLEANYNSRVWRPRFEKIVKTFTPIQIP